MANFRTHLFVGAAASGAMSIVALTSGLISAPLLPSYFLIGSAAALLPDIDSDNSVPVRLFFNLIAVAVAFVLLFSLAGRYTIAELLMVWLGGFVLVRYLVFELFIRMTIHRGVFHTIMAAFCFAFMTVCFGFHLLQRSALESWLAGLFVLVGYLVHLLLDELYSVDLANAKVKRSFGTALKLVSVKSPGASVVMLCLTVWLFVQAPSSESFVSATFNDQLYQRISDKFWPAGRWFAGLWPQSS